MRALVLAILTLLAHGGTPPGASEVADAITWAVEHDARRGTTPGEVEAAVLAYYAWRESNLQRHPYPISWDARAMKSCDVWQMPCALVGGKSLREQASMWLSWVHDVGIAAVDSDAVRATKRVTRSLVLLERARGLGATERQP